MLRQGFTVKINEDAKLMMVSKETPGGIGASRTRVQMAS